MLSRCLLGLLNLVHGIHILEVVQIEVDHERQKPQEASNIRSQKISYPKTKRLLSLVSMMMMMNWLAGIPSSDFQHTVQDCHVALPYFAR